jgi:hypothetical protein
MICDPDPSIWPSAILQLIGVAFGAVFGAALSWFITAHTQKRRSLIEARREEFRAVIAEVSNLYTNTSYVTINDVDDTEIKVLTVVNNRIFVGEEIRKLKSWREWFQAYKALENIHKTLVEEGSELHFAVDPREKEGLAAFADAGLALIAEIRSVAKKEV